MKKHAKQKPKITRGNIMRKKTEKLTGGGSIQTKKTQRGISNIIQHSKKKHGGNATSHIKNTIRLEKNTKEN